MNKGHLNKVPSKSSFTFESKCEGLSSMSSTSSFTLFLEGKSEGKVKEVVIFLYILKYRWMEYLGK